MGVRHASVTVGTTATSLIAGVSDINNYRSVVLTNTGTASVFVGGSDVTTSSYGYELKSGGELALDLESGDVVYGISVAAGGQVRVLHTRV